MNKTEIAKPNIRTEAIAGVTTFFTMAYIVVVNPSILSTSGTGMAFSGVLTAIQLPAGMVLFCPVGQGRPLTAGDVEALRQAVLRALTARGVLPQEGGGD